MAKLPSVLRFLYKRTIVKGRGQDINPFKTATFNYKNTKDIIDTLADILAVRDTKEVRGSLLGGIIPSVGKDANL